jgi:tripartite-type tricarboxylate transporter receptor subunit TctC
MNNHVRGNGAANPALRWFKRALSTTGLIAAICGGISAQAAQQEWPTKPVRMVVGFSAGSGVADLLGRYVAEKLTKYNGQTFLFDNRPGAAGNIAAGIVARANPDGYHLLFAPGSVLTMNPSLYKEMPFDTESFATVSLLADMGVLLVVHPKNPAKNLAEFIAAARRDAGKMNMSSPGAGSSLHLANELFQRAAGVSLQHIAYKGGEFVTAVIAGQATGMFANPPHVMAQIKAGNLRALAVAGSKRLPQLPDVPTTAESGLDGFDISSWFGLVVPARTPRQVVTQLSTQIAKALREPDVQQRLIEFGVRPIGSTPEEFAAFLKTDRTKWDGIIRAANIRLD